MSDMHDVTGQFRATIHNAGRLGHFGRVQDSVLVRLRSLAKARPCAVTNLAPTLRSQQRPAAVVRWVWTGFRGAAVASLEHRS